MDERSGQLSGHHNLGENAVLYIMERLAELRADLRACRSDYQHGKLAHDEYIGIRKSKPVAASSIRIGRAAISPTASWQPQYTRAGTSKEVHFA